MIKHFIPILVAGTLCACVQSADAAKYTLVKDGVSRCAIVLPQDCSASMEFGANDLSKHLKLISDADVAIYKQKDSSDIPAGYEGIILVTDKPDADETPTTKEAFRINTRPGKPWTIRIYGDSKRGAMYGCYGLLQDVLGCRWFTKTISKIPKQKTITLGNLDIEQKPAFEYREPFYAEALYGPKEWLARNRANGNSCNLDASVGGKVRYGVRSFVHTMFTLVPPSKYFAEHPEYFALNKGHRVQHTQLCLTNPDVLKISIEGVKEWIKEDPTAEIFSVSQQDSPSGACECENCKKIVEEEGSECGPILRFVNAVAAEVGKEYPHAIIDTLAYNYSQTPPKHVKPLPNVRVRLCLPWSCKAHSLTAKCGQRDFKDLQAWGEITNQLYIWDYNTDFGNYQLLHPSMDYTKTIYKIYKQNGVVGSFMQGSYTSMGGSFAELKSYLSARLMWDPNQNADKIMDEYIDNVYGKSANIVKEWIALLISPFNEDPSITLGIYDFPSARYLNKKVMDKSDKFLMQAYLASVDDPAALEELGKLRMCLDYSRLGQIVTSGVVKDGKYLYNVTPEDLDRIDRWVTAVKHYKVERISEGVPVNFNEILTRAESQLDCLSLESDRLRVDVLPTVGGKIIRLVDKKKNEDLLLPPASVFEKVEGSYDSYTSHAIRDSEFWGTKFESSKTGNVLTLKGVSPAGREITKQYTLEGNQIVLKNTVKNTTSQPLDVQFRERGMYPIKSFKDIHISFPTTSGGNIALDENSFTDNWLELSKWYLDGNKPSGKIVFKLRDTTLTNQFNPDMLAHFYVNNDMYTTRVNLELFCNNVTLKPGESVSFEQTWTID